MVVAISIVIPGRPHAQGRPRAVRTGSTVRMIDPPRSRAWKALASALMRQARGRAPIIDGPVGVWIDAIFARPARSRSAERSWCITRVGDADNIAKAVLDAGNGVLWRDDAQVVSLLVRRIYARPGESSRVSVVVENLG